jgi:large subunit ribosomal protein L6
MSRVGKLPIQLPEKVQVEVKGNTVTVEGPKGKLSQDFNSHVEIRVEDNQLVVDRTNESKAARSYHGLYRQLCQNMVIGVSQGFTKSLLINGVGYRAEVKGDTLHLNLGFSNPIEFVIPEGITVTTEGANKVIITGTQKQLVGQISSEIRSLRPPEPYKGKGVKYENERIVRKIGKSGVK